MLYIYALLHQEPAGFPGLGQEPALSPGAGLLGEPLRLVACGPLIAVVGEMSAVPHLKAELLRGHEAVVRRLFAAAPAILPARFGSLARDAEVLARMLKPREAQLEEALRLVQGCEQMTLRIYGRRDHGGHGGDGGHALHNVGTRGEDRPAAAAALHRELPGPLGEPRGPGTRYLAEKLREQQAPEELPALEEIRARLEPWVKAERVRRHNGSERGGALQASVYHLIERGQSAAYLAGLAACANGDAAFSPAASGPWPPYAFGPEWL